MTHLLLHKTPNLVSSEPGAAQIGVIYNNALLQQQQARILRVERRLSSMEDKLSDIEEKLSEIASALTQRRSKVSKVER